MLKHSVVARIGSINGKLGADYLPYFEEQLFFFIFFLLLFIFQLLTETQRPIFIVCGWNAANVAFCATDIIITGVIRLNRSLHWGPGVGAQQPLLCAAPKHAGRWLCYLTASPESVCYILEQRPQLLNSLRDDLPASFQWQWRRATITPLCVFCCSDSLLSRHLTLVLSNYLVFFPLSNEPAGRTMTTGNPPWPACCSPSPSLKSEYSHRTI